MSEWILSFYFAATKWFGHLSVSDRRVKFFPCSSFWTFFLFIFFINRFNICWTSCKEKNPPPLSSNNIPPLFVCKCLEMDQKAARVASKWRSHNSLLPHYSYIFLDDIGILMGRLDWRRLMIIQIWTVYSLSMTISLPFLLIHRPKWSCTVLVYSMLSRSQISTTPYGFLILDFRGLCSFPAMELWLIKNMWFDVHYVSAPFFQNFFLGSLWKMRQKVK